MMPGKRPEGTQAQERKTEKADAQGREARPDKRKGDRQTSHNNSNSR